MLLGRPTMEALGLVLDCRSRMIKLDDTPWQDAVVGAHGEYLVSLLNEYTTTCGSFLLPLNSWSRPMVASVAISWTSRQQGDKAL